MDISGLISGMQLSIMLWNGKFMNRIAWKGAGMNIDETVKYFQSHGVKCKKVEDDSPEYGDFIAIFSYGDLGNDKIMEHIRENNLLCIQFKSAIYENERKKGDHNGE